jgi:hypothetical protein
MAFRECSIPYVFLVDLGGLGDIGGRGGRGGLQDCCRWRRHRMIIVGRPVLAAGLAT